MSTASDPVAEALGAGVPPDAVLDVVDLAIEDAAAARDGPALTRLASLLAEEAAARGDAWSGLAVAAARARALAAQASTTGHAVAEPELEPAAVAPAASGSTDADVPELQGARPRPVYAGWWRRSAAFAIDCVALAFAYGILGEIGGDDGGDLEFVAAVVVGFLYFVALHAFAEGATAGKAVFRIALQGADGRPVGFGRAAARAVATSVIWITVVVGLVDMIVGAADERRQWLHDKVAGTVVVRT